MFKCFLQRLLGLLVLVDRAAECCFPSERVYNRIKVREERCEAQKVRREEKEMELRRMDQEHKVRHGDAAAAPAPPRGGCGGGGKFSSFGLGGGDEQSGKTPFTAAESSLPNSFRGKK